MSRTTLRAARGLVATLVLLDLLALVAFSLHRTTTTTTRATSYAAALHAAPAPAVTAAPLPVIPAAPQTHALQPVAGRPSRTVSTTHAGSAPVVAAPPPSPTTPAAPMPSACPLPLAPPAETGGLQSLITFAPAFGPFSAEAFAAASAYQPVLTLIGPLLAQYPTLAPTLDPILTPLLGGWETLLNAGYDATSPLYAPYRQQVLNAETQLATALAPYSQQLAASAPASCLIAVESALVQAAPR